MVRLFSLTVALAGLATLPQGFGLVDKWTPANFDWGSLLVNDTVPSGIWMKVSDAPATTNISALSPWHPRRHFDDQEEIAVLAALGVIWRITTAAVAVYDLTQAVKTCTDVDNKKTSTKDCLLGIFRTVMSVGGAASANKKIIKKGLRFLLGDNVRPDGTIDWQQNIIPPRAVRKRDVLAQMEHDASIRYHLQSLSAEGTEPEFLGYADSDHYLAQGGYGTHPLVPMFRFQHFELGSMEMTSRDTVNGTHFTLAFSGQSTHLLGRRAIQELEAKRHKDKFDEEALKKHAVEARFDTAASRADPAHLKATARGLYNTFDPYLKCALKKGVRGKHVLQVQMFDRTNEATFGFGSMGIFANVHKANRIEHIGPDRKDLPLTHCSKKH